jgi:hypothetical protein
MLLAIALAHARPDPAGLEQLTRDLYAGVDRMELSVPVDGDAFVAFVADEAGAPLALTGTAGADRLRALFAGWKAEGYTAVTRLSELRCIADRRLGTCSASLSQDLLQNGAVLDTLALRVSLAATWSGGAWSLQHLHESAGPK